MAARLLRAHAGARIVRHGPEVHLPSSHRGGPVRFPVAHVELVRDDARAGPQLGEELGAELQVHAPEQVERHDRRVAQIGAEEVELAELDAIGDARSRRCVPCLGDEPPVDVDADPARRAPGPPG